MVFDYLDAGADDEISLRRGKGKLVVMKYCHLGFCLYVQLKISQHVNF